jgi:hypothetical protein
MVITDTYVFFFLFFFDSKRVEDKIAEKQKSSEEKRNEVSTPAAPAFDPSTNLR